MRKPIFVLLISLWMVSRENESAVIPRSESENGIPPVSCEDICISGECINGVCESLPEDKGGDSQIGSCESYCTEGVCVDGECQTTENQNEETSSSNNESKEDFKINCEEICEEGQCVEDVCMLDILISIEINEPNKRPTSLQPSHQSKHHKKKRPALEQSQKSQNNETGKEQSMRKPSPNNLKNKKVEKNHSQHNVDDEAVVEEPRSKGVTEPVEKPSQNNEGNEAVVEESQSEGVTEPVEEPSQNNEGNEAVVEEPQNNEVTKPVEEQPQNNKSNEAVVEQQNNEVNAPVAEESNDIQANGQTPSQAGATIAQTGEENN